MINNKTIFYFFFSAFLLILGDFLIVQRTVSDFNSNNILRGDSIQYIKMINEGFSKAENPYRYRIMVPIIAKMLPFKPYISLKIITYISLFLIYFFAFKICELLNLEISQTSFSILLIYLTPIHLYNYHNPFLIDGFTLLIITLLIFFCIIKNFSGFIIFIIIGSLTRETILFTAPLWFLTVNKKKGLIPIAISFLIIVSLRLIIKIEHSDMFTNSQFNLSFVPFVNTISYFKNILSTWYYYWIFMLIGIFISDSKFFSLIFFSFLLIFISSCFSSLLATDTKRMFAFLTPIMIITTSLVLSNVKNKNIPIIYLYIMTFLSILFSTFSVTNNILDFEKFPVIYKILRNSTLLFLFISSMLLVIPLVRDFKNNFFNNFRHLK